VALVDDLLTDMPRGAYLRTSEVAKILRVSSKTVSRWASEGRLPHVVTLGGHRRFPRSVVTDLADKLNDN